MAIAIQAGQQYKNKNTGQINTATATQDVGGGKQGQFLSTDFEIVKPEPTQALAPSDFNSPTPKIPEMTKPEEVAVNNNATANQMATLQTKNVQTDIDALLKSIQTPTTTETEQGSLSSQLKSALEDVKGKSTRLAEEEQKAGVNDKIKELQGINQQIAQVQAGLNLGVAKEESRPIARQFITGRVAEMQRQATAELGALSLTAQAIQGNINLAQQTAQRIVDLEFGDKEQEIENLKTLIDLNYQSLTREDKKRADELSVKLQARKEALDDEKQTKTDINSLAIEAGKAGADAATIQNILKAKTVEEAVLSGAEFLDVPDTTIIDIGGRKKLINSKTGDVIKDLGASDKDTQKPQKVGTDSFGNEIFGTYNEETRGWDVIPVPNVSTMSNDQISSALLTSLSGLNLTADARKSVLSEMNRLLKTGDVEKAKEFLVTTIKNSARTADADKFAAWDQGLDDIATIEAGLAKLKEKGIDTGLLKGYSEKAWEKFAGKIDDPELAKVANDIKLAIINFRKNASGAAFTESEKKDYESVFPDIAKSGDLNEQKIKSLKENFNRNLTNKISRTIGESNYDLLFGTTSTVPQLGVLNKSYNSIDLLVQENPEYQQLYDYIIELNPKMTDTEILQEVYRMQGSFNQPVSAGVNSSTLGKLSEKYESGGDPGRIGYDNTGGWSYGVYQLAHNNAQSFVRQSKYAKDFSGLVFNSQSWRNKWQEVAKKDPTGFASEQKEYIEKTHFSPQVNQLKQFSAITKEYSPVFWDVVWSTAVHHGANNQIVASVLQNYGKKLSESEIIKKIYAMRWSGGKNFAKSTADVVRGVYNRFFGKNGELQTALNELKKYGRTNARTT